MVKHRVFGVERDIDVSIDRFPSPERLQELEAPLDVHGCQHGWFPSTFRGHPRRPKTFHLHYRYFLPPQQPPKAVVIFMHGLQNHGGCAYIMPQSGSPRNMAALSTELLGRRMAVYAFDLIGHGYSEGYRFVLPSADTLIQDYLQFVEIVVQQHPDTPLVLMGESLGGNLTLQVARHYQDHPTARPSPFLGVALIAPAIYPTNTYLPQQILLRMINPWMGIWRPPSWIPSPLDATQLWRDPERIALAQQQPHNGIAAPPAQHPPYRTLGTLCDLMRKVRDRAIPGLTVPFGVVHGARDEAIPVAGSEWLVEQAQLSGLVPHEDLAYKIYPEALHDLLAEPEAEEMMVWLADWIERRIETYHRRGPPPEHPQTQSHEQLQEQPQKASS